MRSRALERSHAFQVVVLDVRGPNELLVRRADQAENFRYMEQTMKYVPLQPNYFLIASFQVRVHSGVAQHIWSDGLVPHRKPLVPTCGLVGHGAEAPSGSPVQGAVRLLR